MLLLLPDMVPPLLSRIISTSSSKRGSMLVANLAEVSLKGVPILLPS